MNELWVARDADGDVWMFLAEPRKDNGRFYPPDVNRAIAYISDSVAVAFNLRPGECKRLVLAEETSE